jgi:GPI mannosyltransferase 3
LHAGDVIRSRWTFLTSIWGEAGARMFAVAVVATHLVAAWFNAGYLSADEHYQIIEFAQYKLGRQSVSALAWEFTEQMRPALQPWLASIAIRVHELLGATSPFTIAFSLRLLSSIVAAVVALEVCVRCLRPVRSRVLRQAAVFLALLLWIAPTAHARFSSENWGGTWLAAGVCLVIDAVDAWPADRRRSILSAAAAGAAWSLAFYCRFQVAIAIAGIGVWLIFVKRAPAALFAALAVAFVAVCGANTALDRWLYGGWTLSPLNYVRVNLIEGKSAAYGMAPWWLVLVYLFVVLVPPFSLALIALLVIGTWRARRDIVVWTSVPFIAVHMLAAHKEPRFVIPLVYFIGPWLAVSVAALPDRVTAALTRWSTTLVAIAIAFCAVDLFALCVTISMPVNDRIALDRWLWNQHSLGIRTVYTLGRRKNDMPENVTNSFYDGGVVMAPLDRDASAQLPSHAPAFVYYPGTAVPAELVRLGCKPVFRTYPAWLASSKLFLRLAEVEADSICRIDRAR